MDWTFSKFHLHLKDLRPQVREKAIEIARELIEKKHLPEETAIQEAIKQAEEWFMNSEG